MSNKEEYLEDEESSVPQLIQDWINSLSALQVRALAILGPSSADDVRVRDVWAAHPVSLRPAAEVLATSDAYGPSWRATNSPALAWQNIAESPGEHWQRTLTDHGIRAVVRSDVAMPFGSGYECIALVGRQLVSRSEAFEIGWALSNCWPVLKDAVIASRFGLTARTREVLRFLAEGRTAKETADLVGVKERAIHYHLSTVMQKLNADNRAAAILRACMLGIL